MISGRQGDDAERNIRVWRSLVSRLNGVQEAAGSNPVTRTKNPCIRYEYKDFLLFYTRFVYALLQILF